VILTFPFPSSATGPLQPRRQPPELPRRLRTLPPQSFSSVPLMLDLHGEPCSLLPCPAGSPSDPGAHAAAPATPSQPGHRRQPCHDRRPACGDCGLGAPARAVGMGPVGQNRPWAVPRLRGLGRMRPKTVHQFFFSKIPFSKFKFQKFVATSKLCRKSIKTQKK
jgi:hypothetical protein